MKTSCCTTALFLSIFAAIGNLLAQEWSNVDAVPQLVPLNKDKMFVQQEFEISQAPVTPGECMDGLQDAPCHITPPPVTATAQAKHKKFPPALRIDVGAQWNYVQVTSPGITTYHGQSWGAHTDVTYSKPWALFADVGFFWNHTFLHSGSTYKRSLEEVDFEGLLGYAFGFARKDRGKIIPFVGLEYNKLSDHRSNDLFIPNIRLYYYTIFIPFGLEIDYFATPWFETSFRFTAMPSINQRLLIPTMPGVNWLLNDRFSYRVDIPLRFIVINHKKYQMDVRLTPSYRFMAIGAADVLDLPKRNFSYYSVLLDIGFAF